MSHRVILLNFTEREAHIVTKAGYNVERGYLGIQVPSPTGVIFPFNAPHPLYEYDVFFYNSRIPDEVKNEFSSARSYKNLRSEKGSLEALMSFDTPPYVRVSFIGVSSGMDVLMYGGVPFVHLIKAEENVSSFVEGTRGITFSIPELHDVIASFKGQIAGVGQFFTGDAPYPFYYFSVLRSKNGSRIAGYGTTYDKGTRPRYIILPQLKNNAHAVVELLRCLENTFAELFPDRVKRDWLNTDEFTLPEERAIQDEIQRRIAETREIIEMKEKELEALRTDNSFVRGLLTATEDSKIDPADRLSGVVKKALEFLEFKVEDIDQKTKSAIKKEDFWVIDGDFLAITEVTGTTHKNPKVKEFNDILGRMATIYKRKGDLVLPSAANVSGLLVLNYDIDSHPAKRPRVYTGDEEHIVDTATEQGIGLLSTVELHKIVVAVKQGLLTKDEARAILRKPGRIELLEVHRQAGSQ